MPVYTQASVAYISTQTTTQVVTGPATLHTITVTGGAAGTIIVYDAASGTTGTVISFDSTNAIATYTFDIAFGNGIRIATGAATKLTVSYFLS